ncbi:hypothetical protein [Streptomyces anulatus]|uniref:hypothetical protein n=1 Tax=Streptomyces anulatus TaxID=1892 RepID=UPI0035D8F340
MIDMQIGCVNHHSRHVVPAAADLVARWSAAGGLLVARRLVGTGRLVDTDQVMGPLDTRVAGAVLE